MDVVSYRGPGVAGGVSSGLGTAWRKEADSSSKWWFINKGVLEVLSAKADKPKFISMLPESLIEGHYGFCNDFLWPLMHDLPQYATYSPENHEHYRTFNKIIAEQIDVESIGRQEYFIQDYQLCLAPRWLSALGHKTVLFWHIPWPKSIPDEFVEPLRELASGLLGASTLGFHTPEYAENFMAFVSKYLPGCKVNRSSLIIENSEEQARQYMRNFARAAHKSYVMQQHIHNRSRHGGPTKLLVHPLGIDFEFWTELRDSCKESDMDQRLINICNSKFILSVDRVDYTKAVLDRLLIVDRFFETHPEQVGQVSFVQVCGRSRPGLPAFDRYWHSCRSLLGAVNNRWKVGDWKPVDWIEHSLSPKDLSYLYSNADCMLVNPVRDGLNLTAKEFIACQDSQPGVLLLSPGAGAIHELGDYSLSAAPGDREGTVASIAKSLNMPLRERQHRALKMKTILVSNQLSHWWTAFSQVTRVPDMHLVAREEEDEELMRNLG